MCFCSTAEDPEKLKDLSTIIDKTAASLGYARLKRKKEGSVRVHQWYRCVCVYPHRIWQVVLCSAAIYLRCEEGIGGKGIYCHGSVATDSPYESPVRLLYS